jgi:hypothetical protein
MQLGDYVEVVTQAFAMHAAWHAIGGPVVPLVQS